jgi:hypothetical protein
MLPIYGEIFKSEGRLGPLDLHKLALHSNNLKEMFDRQHQIERAINETGMYTISDDVATRDVESIYRNGSISGAIEEQRQRNKVNEFNERTVSEVFREDEEKHTLWDIASNGITIDTPTGFHNVIKPQRMRKIQTTLTNTITKGLVKLWEKGKGIIIPIDKIPIDEKEKIHFQATGWKGEPDKLEGRITYDGSHSDNGQSALNDNDAKEKGETRYGKIEYPTIQTIITNWYNYAESINVTLPETRAYKDDIEAAYPQLRFNATSALLCATLLTTSLVFIYTTGQFGWCAMPMVWGVIMRAMLRKARQPGYLKGVIDICR